VSRDGAGHLCQRCSAARFLLDTARERACDEIAAGLALTGFSCWNGCWEPHGKEMPQGPDVAGCGYEYMRFANQNKVTPWLPLPDEIRSEPLSKALAERYLAYALSTITQRRCPMCATG
jgi:hypothetical protein